MTHYRSTRLAVLSSLLASLLVPGGAFGAFFALSEGGDSTPASIQDTVDLFRAIYLEDPNNGNVPGTTGGRREINWDGGGSATTISPTPFNGFLNTRGASFTTPLPGIAFIQAPPSGFDAAFGNPNLSSTFGVFSAQRIFSPISSNITDVHFFVPGTNGSVPATVSGFGAVFTDVDLNGSTRIQFFDGSDNKIFDDIVPPGLVASQSLSFLGAVGTAGEQIFRVRITTGNTPIASNFVNPQVEVVDAVAMDDFLFSEPVAVPEPGAAGLVGVGMIALVWSLQRRRERSSPVEV